VEEHPIQQWRDRREKELWHGEREGGEGREA
jgi:hypothetical protein